MTRRDDPWRLPALDKLGAQLRSLEDAHRPDSASASRRLWRPISISGAGVAAALVVALVFIDTGRPASALSAITHAPTAAAEARSVRFQSTVKIVISGGVFRGFRETGQIDFATGAYSTSLASGPSGGLLERRLVAGVLYVGQVRRGNLESRTRWLAIRLAGGQSATVASAREADPILDPSLLLRALATAHSGVTVIGRQELDGAPTTRYRLVTDLGSFLRASSGESAHEADRNVSVTLDVWLDARGRPRRLDETFFGASYLGPASITTDVVFSGYGAPVAVTAPAGLVQPAPLRVAAPDVLGPDPLRLFKR
jgi:hypothetical protein